jgi:formylglycine-generating enzyme required for sulfatase activity
VVVFPAGATPEGVADMTGNVFEWTAPDGDSDVAVATAACRGGAWTHDLNHVAATRRLESSRDQRSENVGFRVAADLVKTKRT